MTFGQIARNEIQQFACLERPVGHKQRLFTKRGQPLRARYLPQLSLEATAALNSLGRHFASDGRLAAIRNQQSFHYSDDHDLVEQYWPNIPETEPWNLYLSGPNYNSFYYVSELVICNVTARLAMPSDAKSMTGHLEQEELRFLELLRDRLNLDRLTTAAIEVAARARHRRMPG